MSPEFSAREGEGMACMFTKSGGYRSNFVVVCSRRGQSLLLLMIDLTCSSRRTRRSSNFWFCRSCRCGFTCSSSIFFCRRRRRSFTDSSSICFFFCRRRRRTCSSLRLGRCCYYYNTAGQQ